MKTDFHTVASPVVWVTNIVVTVGLLLVFQQSLWIVVPTLLALLAYYALYPFVQALVLRGVDRGQATAVVMLVFALLACVLSALVVPQAWDHARDWQASVELHLQGGLHLLDKALRALEFHFPPLARAHLADTMAHRLSQSSSIIQYLEPMATGVATGLPSLMLVPFLAFYFLRDGRRFKNFLCSAIPNAFFDKSLVLLKRVDHLARAYFQGLIVLTLLDTLTLATGLWLLGFPRAFFLGLICAVLAWIPYVGSIMGGLLVVLVAATDFPNSPTAYMAICLFLVVRLLDDFVYMPMTIGRNLRMHPVVTVVMIFVGGAVAGTAGLMLVLPVLGVVRVVGETVSTLVNDERLIARHRHARRLRQEAAVKDLSESDRPHGVTSLQRSLSR